MLMISPAINPPSTAPGNEPTPPITTTTKVCTRMSSPTPGVSETTGAFTMPANPAAIAPMPNTIMNTRYTSMPSESTITESSMPAHDHADACAVEHQKQRKQSDCDDADQRKAIGRVKHEAEGRDTGEQFRRRNRYRQAAEEKSNDLDQADRQAERDQQLVLVRAMIKVANDHALDQHADEHHEQRARDHRNDEGFGV